MGATKGLDGVGLLGAASQSTPCSSVDSITRIALPCSVDQSCAAIFTSESVVFVNSGLESHSQEFQKALKPPESPQ